MNDSSMRSQRPRSPRLLSHLSCRPASYSAQEHCIVLYGLPHIDSLLMSMNYSQGCYMRESVPVLFMLSVNNKHYISLRCLNPVSVSLLLGARPLSRRFFEDSASTIGFDLTRQFTTDSMFPQHLLNGTRFREKHPTHFSHAHATTCFHVPH